MRTKTIHGLSWRRNRKSLEQPQLFAVLSLRRLYSVVDDCGDNRRLLHAESQFVVGDISQFREDGEIRKPFHWKQAVCTIVEADGFLPLPKGVEQRWKRHLHAIEIHTAFDFKPIQPRFNARLSRDRPPICLAFGGDKPSVVHKRLDSIVQLRWMQLPANLLHIRLLVVSKT